MMIHDAAICESKNIGKGTNVWAFAHVLPGASLTLPLRAEPFEDKRLFPFFDGLIPEGWLLEIAEKTWKIDPRDRMGLLLACCRDCIGAAGVVPIEEETAHE